MIKSSYEVEVLVNGRPLREYLHDRKLYIEGRKDTKFSLRLRNNSSKRKLFVPSIDGLSVMDGKEASFDSSGYIVGPWSAVTIDGWRTSDKDVAQFFFSSPEKSYAKKKGKGANLGIVGVAVFGEKETRIVFDQRDYWPDIFPKEPIKPSWWPSRDRITWTGAPLNGTSIGREMNYFESSSVSVDGKSPKTSSMALSCSSDGEVSATYQDTSGEIRAYSNQQLGTGWGSQKQSEVVSTSFAREEQPREIFELFYNTREELEKIGVSLEKEAVYVSPQSFPAETRYCEPPRG